MEKTDCWSRRDGLLSTAPVLEIFESLTTPAPPSLPLDDNHFPHHAILRHNELSYFFFLGAGHKDQKEESITWQVCQWQKDKF